MFRLALKRSLRSFQADNFSTRRNIVGVSSRIPNYEQRQPFKSESQILPQIQELKDEVEVLKGGVEEEVKRLEHKIEVSKIDNSWENRQLTTELNEIDQKQTERTDALARDVQQHKAEFHRTFEAWTKDVQQQIENLHLRFDKGEAPKTGSVILSAVKKVESAKEVAALKGVETLKKAQDTEKDEQKAAAILFGSVLIILFVLFPMIATGAFESFSLQTPISRDNSSGQLRLRSPVWYDFVERDLRERERIAKQKERERDLAPKLTHKEQMLDCREKRIESREKHLEWLEAARGR